MGRYKIEYKNLREEYRFPEILGIKIVERGGIILLDILHKRGYISITDEVGYDKEGSYLSVSWSRWYDRKTFEEVPQEVVNCEGYSSWDRFDDVSCTVKLYTGVRGRFACYSESTEDRHYINFIPYSLLRFDGDGFNCLGCFREYSLD